MFQLKEKMFVLCNYYQNVLLVGAFLVLVLLVLRGGDLSVD